MSQDPAKPVWKPPQGRPARILLVRLSALGDVLHALPALAALKRWNPGCQVDWAVEDRWAPLLEGHPDLERVVVLPRREMSAAVRGLPRPLRAAALAQAFRRTLQAGDYDLALDLQGNLKSGLVARASGARRTVGMGRTHSREGNRWLMHATVPLPQEARHKVERHLALLAGVLGEPVPYAAPRLPLAPADDESACAALLAAALPERGSVLLHPGSSGFGAFKRWPADRWAGLARTLAREGAAVGITFGPGEEPLAHEVAALAADAARVVVTPSLKVLAAVLARAGRLIAGDTGPLHLAAVLGTPVLGLFGPKDPRVYGPYGQRPDGSAGLLPYVVQPDVACRPCGLRRCAAPLCLTTLAPARVLEALR